MNKLQIAYLESRKPKYINESERDFVDWACEIRLAIYDKCQDPTVIRDCTPDYFEINEPATVVNPNPKTRTVVKKP